MRIVTVLLGVMVGLVTAHLILLALWVNGVVPGPHHLPPSTAAGNAYR
jgi:hypothetical protein